MGAYTERAAAAWRAAQPVYDSPSDRAAIDHLRGKLVRDARLARGSAYTKSRPAHQMCGGGCGAVGKPGHENCQLGCGTHSARHCGGRRAAASMPLSRTHKSDTTLRIALGLKRQARINARGW